MADKIKYTPLAKKLGLREDLSVLVYNVPESYGDKLGDVAAGLNWLDSISKERADFIHLFCTSEKELTENLKRYIPALKRSGMLWISWPKEDTNISSELDRSRVTQIIHPLELVRVHGEILDDAWHALKFRYPQKGE